MTKMFTDIVNLINDYQKWSERICVSREKKW